MSFKTYDEIQAKVCKVVEEVLAISIDEIDLDASIEKQLAPDSMDQVRLYMVLEDEFDGSIPDEDLKTIHTVRDIINYISRRLGVET